MKNQTECAGPVSGQTPFAPVDPVKVVQSIVDVVCAIDGEGIFRYVSPSSGQLFGYSSEAMTGQPFTRFIYPPDIQKTVELVRERYHDCRTSNFENRYVHKEGFLVPVIWSGRWDEADGLLYCVARNGTEKQDLEHRLLKAQQMARVANFEFDTESRNYTYVSDTLFEIFGLDRAEHPSFTIEGFWSRIHPEDVAYVKEAIEGPGSGSRSTLDYRIIQPGGAVVYILHLREIIGDPHGQPEKIIGTLQDITERKKIELAHRQSEERLQNLVQNGNDLLGIIDLQGRYSFVGENVQPHLGYRAEELIGRSAFEFIHPEDAPAVVAGLQTIEDHASLTIGPFRFHNKAGEWRWMETTISNHLHSPSIQGLVTNSRDITEKKIKEDKLRWSEHRFQALVYNGSDLIVILDGEARFTYVSDNSASVLGYSAQELLGKSALRLMHPEDRDNITGELHAVVHHPGATKAVQHRIRNKDGAWLWMESKGSNHLSTEGIRGILVNARLIDDRVRLQNRLNQELMNKQKEITTAVIRAQETERSQLGLELHDNVNQILTTVKLYNELFLSGYIEDKELLHKSNHYLQECINEIRSISKRLSAPTLGRISLQDSIEELVSSINLTRRVEVSYRAQGIDQYNLSEDLHLSIYRIVQESLNNMIKYSGATKASVEIRRGAKKICLKITDNGKGFDTAAERQGIGITNMRTRAEHLNASFRLISAPGKGCTIQICFPEEAPLQSIRSASL